MRVLALVVLGIALGCSGHRSGIVLPPHGVDVDVHVKVGKDALQGGTAEAPRCTCCPAPPTPAVCRCVKGGDGGLR